MHPNTEHFIEKCIEFKELLQWLINSNLVQLARPREERMLNWGPKTISVETETKSISTNRRHLIQLKPRPRPRPRLSSSRPSQYNQDQMYIGQLKPRPKSSRHRRHLGQMKPSRLRSEPSRT
ncbi:hypothetical protein CR513_58864, partial [Mucuna pruriens]